MRIEIIENHAVDIIDVIRRSPVAEVMAASEKLQHCLRVSQISWAGVVDGEVACVWGVITPSLLSNQAYLWLLTTNISDEHKFCLIRHSQQVIDALLDDFPILVGHVHAERPQSIRWLKRLGAKFGNPEGLKIPFRIERWTQ